MKNFLLATLAACVLALTCAALFILRDIHRTLTDADASVVSVKKLADDTTPKAQAILVKIDDAAEQAKLAASEERGNWNKTAKETALTARALRTLIDRTDRQLNDVSLPNLDAQIDQVSAGTQVSVEAIGHSADVLTEQLNDPHIMSLAANLDQSAANMSKATQQFADSAADIRGKVHDLTKPETKKQKILGDTKASGSILYMVLRIFSAWP